MQINFFKLYASSYKNRCLYWQFRLVILFSMKLKNWVRGLLLWHGIKPGSPRWSWTMVIDLHSWISLSKISSVMNWLPNEKLKKVVKEWLTYWSLLEIEDKIYFIRKHYSFFVDGNEFFLTKYEDNLMEEKNKFDDNNKKPLVSQSNFIWLRNYQIINKVVF